MKTNENPKNDPLDGLLRQWSVPETMPPRFQEQVWQRIAKAETPVAPGVWTRVWTLLNDLLPRPTVAAAYLSVLLGLGIVAGSLAAQARTSRVETEMGFRYVQSINPYQSEFTRP
jgi:hypothetical protein